MTNIRLLLMFASMSLSFSIHAEGSLEDSLKSLSSSLELLEKTVKQNKGVQVAQKNPVLPAVPWHEELMEKRRKLRPASERKPTEVVEKPTPPTTQGVLESAMEKLRKQVQHEDADEGGDDEDWETD